MIIWNQDRDIAIELFGDESEVFYSLPSMFKANEKNICMGINLYLARDRDVNVFLGTFDNLSDVCIELHNITSCTSDEYFISGYEDYDIWEDEDSDNEYDEENEIEW